MNLDIKLRKSKVKTKSKQTKTKDHVQYQVKHIYKKYIHNIYGGFDD